MKCFFVWYRWRCTTAVPASVYSEILATYTIITIPYFKAVLSGSPMTSSVWAPARKLEGVLWRAWNCDFRWIRVTRRWWRTGLEHSVLEQLHINGICSVTLHGSHSNFRFQVSCIVAVYGLAIVCKEFAVIVNIRNFHFCRHERYKRRYHWRNWFGRW